MAMYNPQPRVSFDLVGPRSVRIVYDGYEIDGVQSINLEHSVDLPSQSMATIRMEFVVHDVKVEQDNGVTTYYLNSYNAPDKLEKFLRLGGKKGPNQPKKKEEK